MARTGKPFNVDTRPTKIVVVDSLTKDATVEACIFDLIDNSIDAARSTILSKLPAKAQQEPPDDYDKFQITVAMSGASFQIIDNCGGIPVDALRTMVLRFGQRSESKNGIGAFGVGLNRALFKLGKVSSLITDTGTQRSELLLKTDDYLKLDDWNLPAEEFPSRGKIGTEIEIKQLPTEIARSFADRQWIDNLRDEVGRRYGRFIDKGFAISLNRKQAENLEPKIRENGPYDPQYKFYKTEDGVSIHIEYGQHQNHRFTAEKDYNAERNKTIPEETGWTILCNERAVIISDKSDKTGWESKFHTEFYGFVGAVNFVGDASKLPWTTTKTDVDLNNAAYRLALKDMSKFTEDWRKFSEQRKKKKGETLRPLPARPKTGMGSATKGRRFRRLPIPVPTTRVDHNQFRTVLPGDVDELHCNDKHLALAHEAKTLDLADFSYSGLALIRMLFETSVVKYMDRHGKLDELKQFAISKREKKIKLTDDVKKKLVPAFDEMLAFLEDNPTLWGSVKGSHLKHCVGRMGQHQKTMNTVLHNPWQLTNKTEAIQIRDDVLPLLRHLIEK